MPKGSALIKHPSLVEELVQVGWMIRSFAFLCFLNLLYTLLDSLALILRTSGRSVQVDA